MGLAIIALMILMAVFALLVASWSGHDPNQVNLEALDEFGLPSAPTWWPGPEAKAPPKYFLGVDDTGRDLFVRIAYGARTSLTVAFFATGIAVVIGVLLGLSSGFYRGKIDTVISRATDVVLALPILLLALGIASACGANQEGCFWGFIKPGSDRDPDHRAVRVAVHRLASSAARCCRSVRRSSWRPLARWEPPTGASSSARSSRT